MSYLLIDLIKNSLKISKGTKRTNNDLQNTARETKDRATRTPLKHGVNLGGPHGYVVPAPLVAPVVLFLLLGDTS